MNLLVLIRHPALWQFVRYGIVGVFNTAFNLAIFNALMFVTGVSRGHFVTVFATVSFAVVVTASFFLNKFFVFEAKGSGRGHVEYGSFFTLTSIVALIDIGIVSLLVNGVGAPQGVDEKLWANIAVLCTIPVSVLGNFFGYKFVVFKRPIQS